MHAREIAASAIIRTKNFAAPGNRPRPANPRVSGLNAGSAPLPAHPVISQIAPGDLHPGCATSSTSLA
jgi:hypothetical protein